MTSKQKDYYSIINIVYYGIRDVDIGVTFLFTRIKMFLFLFIEIALPNLLPLFWTV